MLRFVDRTPLSSGCGMPAVAVHTAALGDGYCTACVFFFRCLGGPRGKAAKGTLMTTSRQSARFVRYEL